MDEYAAFWWGRGAVPTVAPYSHPIQEVPTDANALQPSWLERTERSARACRAWVALAGDFIGLLFRVLVFGATAWVMWTGISVVGEARSALQTEEGARYAGRAVDAFLSALSAPALAALGAGAAALLATVVYVLCGDFGRPRVPAPAAAPGRCAHMSCGDTKKTHKHIKMDCCDTPWRSFLLKKKKDWYQYHRSFVTHLTASDAISAAAGMERLNSLRPSTRGWKAALPASLSAPLPLALSLAREHTSARAGRMHAAACAARWRRRAAARRSIRA